MESISDYSLVEAYLDAVKMNLDKDFLSMLWSEIEDRNLNLCVIDKD
ncbi:sporulation histidine kinase inhibitor Sda [Paenibacillus sp. N3.4]|nr:sporulation histidine kinase inhibitor Sda [Paenibacillus sp. N3.4]